MGKRYKLTKIEYARTGEMVGIFKNNDNELVIDLDFLINNVDFILTDNTFTYNLLKDFILY